jgi:predicted transposase/invertase (TIGR01784 family)
MGLLPKDADILPPYDDRIFKVIMTSPEAKPVLMLVSSIIIESLVVDVLVRNTELPVSDVNEKAQRFDVNCLINNDLQADIEMQANRMREEAGGKHENLRARSIFNLCNLHTSQDSKGKEYNRLIRTYQVMFCAFPIFEGHSELIYRFSMRHDTDNWLLHNVIQSVFVDLTKLGEVVKKPVDRMTDMERFSVFLRYADNPDYRDTVNKVIETREALTVAGEVLMSVSKNERERAILHSRRIAQRDLESNFAAAERIGRAEGRTEGRQEERFAVARSLISMKLPIEQIVLVTGLTREEVEQSRVKN